MRPGVLLEPPRTLVVVATAVLLAACAGERAATSASVRAGTISTEGADIWYQTIGEGRPVIAVHGGPGLDHSYLLPGLEPLALNYKLILYDQRGLGSSTTTLDTASITMTRFLDDIDALRERVAGVERVTLLAHSWGSIPVLLYAMRWPDRVDALILMSPVEPGQRYAEQTNDAQSERRSAADARAIDSLTATPAFQAGDPATVSRLFFHAFRGTFADPTVADTALAIHLSERTARQGRQVARLLMEPLAGLDFWEQLPELTVPVLLVHGAEDPIPLEMVLEMESALPNGRLVVIEGAGHFPFIEQPDDLFGAIFAFLREREAGP